MELYIKPEPITINKKNGQFLKGNIPHNKGKKWSEWMDRRKAKKVKRIAMQNLKGRMDIGGWNKKAIVGIKDGRFLGMWESSVKAGEQLGLTARNIRHCCEGKRKRCGGIHWFREADYKEWSKLLKDENLL